MVLWRVVEYLTDRVAVNRLHTIKPNHKLLSEKPTSEFTIWFEQSVSNNKYWLLYLDNLLESL